jgi:hypothetical protein
MYMSIFFLFFGLIFALVGGVMLWDYITVVTSYEILSAKVIGFRTRYKRSKNSTTLMYYPVIKYIAYGNSREFQSKSGASWPMYDIGEAVEVYYSKKYDDNRLKSVTPAIMGVVFLVIGLVICYLFWANFQMSFFSLVTAVGLSGAIAWFFGSMMRKKGIQSVPDLTQKVRDIRKNARHKSESDGNLITSQLELEEKERTGNKNAQFVGPLFAFIGLVTIGISIYVGMNRWDFLGRAEPVDGKVVDYRSSTDDDGTTYYPIVEFSLPTQPQSITFQHDVGSSHRSYSLGTVVPVLFDPNNTANAIIDEGLWNWFATIMISFVGLLFFWIGSSLTWKLIKRKRYRKKKLSQ